MQIVHQDPVLAQLQADIEALADRVEHVDHTHAREKRSWGRTIAGTPFVTICNGRPEAEVARSIQQRPIEKMARFSLTSARRLRRQIKGPALLTWRDFAHHPGEDLWIRLAFEAA